MGDREERNTVEIDFVDPGIRIENQVEHQMTAFVSSKPHRSTGKKNTDFLEAIHWRSRHRLLRGCRWCDGTEESNQADQPERESHRCGNRWLNRGTAVAV